MTQVRPARKSAATYAQTMASTPQRGRRGHLLDLAAQRRETIRARQHGQRRGDREIGQQIHQHHQRRLP
jgi:hypothetical protein